MSQDDPLAGYCSGVKFRLNWSFLFLKVEMRLIMTQSDTLIATGRYIASLARSSKGATADIRLLETVDNAVNALSGMAETLSGFDKLIHAFIE